MWQILRQNPGAFGGALLLHLILAALVFVGVDWLDASDDVRIKPRVVQATIVSSEAVEAGVQRLRTAEEEARRQAQAERVATEETKRRAAAEHQAAEVARRQAEAKRKADEQARRQAEAKRKADEQAQRQAEAKRKADEQAQRQAEAKRKADEQARRQAEAKRKADEQAQRQAEAKRKADEAARQRREDELLAALDAEQAASELDSYTAAIHDRIAEAWVRQPGMGRNLSCLVEARLIPGGEVTPGSVRLLRSSGNPAFDRSVVAAVYKSSPLPVPSGRLFEQFRILGLEFKP